MRTCFSLPQWWELPSLRERVDAPFHGGRGGSRRLTERAFSPINPNLVHCADYGRSKPLPYKFAQTKCSIKHSVGEPFVYQAPTNFSLPQWGKGDRWRFANGG